MLFLSFYSEERERVRRRDLETVRGRDLETERDSERKRDEKRL